METVLKVELIKNAEGQLSLKYAGSPTDGNYSAESVDALIELLAHMRSEMAPEFPRMEPGIRKDLDAVDDPGVLITTADMIDGALLRIRHPGFGWLAFLLHKNTTRELGQLLLDASQRVETRDVGRLQN